MNLQFDDDFADVIGGDEATPFIRADRVAPIMPDDASSLDADIAISLALHPDVSVAFRNRDLGRIGPLTKMAMVDGINHLLGIKPLV